MLALFAGALADRVDRRWLLIAVQAYGAVATRGVDRTRVRRRTECGLTAGADVRHRLRRRGDDTGLAGDPA